MICLPNSEKKNQGDGATSDTGTLHHGLEDSSDALLCENISIGRTGIA